MRSLGPRHIHAAAPWDEKGLRSAVVTAADSRAEVCAALGPFIQTAPLHIGLLTEMICQWWDGSSALIAAHPLTVTVDEQGEMIQWMRQNRVDGLIPAGVGPSARVVHKPGWTSYTHADARLRSPEVRITLWWSSSIVSIGCSGRKVLVQSLTGLS
jgi:hypothetical protein